MWRRRPDGTLSKNVDNTRRAMPYLMRGRNESAVYLEHDVDLLKADAFISEWNQVNPQLRIDVFHLALWELKEALVRYPDVHRFVAGGRLYDRHGVWFSYAIKAKLAEGAPFITVKRRFDLDTTFGDMVVGMDQEQTRARSGETNTVEKELDLLMKFPSFMRRIIMTVIRAGDRWGTLPRDYIEKDPMFTSCFWANMASLGMPAVFHHLYEYGTGTIFCSIGRPVPVAGGTAIGPDRHRVVTLKWTYDERADDGLATWFVLRRLKRNMEDPAGAGGIVIERLGANAVEPTPEPAPEPEAAAPIETAAAPVDS